MVNHRHILWIIVHSFLQNGKTEMTILASIPIIALIAFMLSGRISAITAYAATFMIAAVIAQTAFSMTMTETLTATLEGVLSALWPICLLIFSSLLLFNLTIGEKEKEQLKDLLIDKESKEDEASVLLIALGISSILETLIGFGISLVIPLSFMISTGYDKIRSARAVLIAVSIPTSFGSLGMPQTNLSTATGIAINEITGLSLLYELPLILLLPYSVLVAYNGRITIRREFLPKLVLFSGLYAAAYEAGGFLAGPILPPIAGGLAISIAIILSKPQKEHKKQHSFRFMLSVITALTMLCLPIFIPPLRRILQMARISTPIYSGPDPKVLRFYLLDTPGILILSGTLIGAFINKIPIADMLSASKKTIKENWKTFLSMCLVFSISALMGYSGMTERIADGIISLTGRLFPIMSTSIGVLGSFITGSNSSSNMLFGPIQATAATNIGVSAALLSTFNAIGASIGKIISPQNMILSSSVCNEITFSSLKKAMPIFAAMLIIATISCCIAVYL